MATPVEQLEHELITRPDQVMVVAGIGVSLATCGNHPCASWKGLLQHGLQHCEEVCGTPPPTLKAYREILSDPTAPAHALIGIGQFITDELNSRRPGIFGRWLSDSIGSIVPTDTRLVRALAFLGGKLATTNYDNIIEAGTRRSPITWRDRALATVFFHESTQDVLHLHGYYRQPDSIILGPRSYEEVCRDEFLQSALRGLMISGTLVFVGCGTGLEDPNFGVLLAWAQSILAQCQHAHFILVRSGEVDDWRTRLKAIPIDPIAYGEHYSDLTPFLEGMAERVHRLRVREPLSLLSSSQTSFDAKWEELERNRQNLTLLEYFQRSIILAAELGRAGGLASRRNGVFRSAYVARRAAPCP